MLCHSAAAPGPLRTGVSVLLELYLLLQVKLVSRGSPTKAAQTHLEQKGLNSEGCWPASGAGGTARGTRLCAGNGLEKPWKRSWAARAS